MITFTTLEKNFHAIGARIQKKLNLFQKHKFLCGHEKRHPFVAAIPENSDGVCNVRLAKDALMLTRVIQEWSRNGFPSMDQNRWNNKAYCPQGDDFAGTPQDRSEVQSSRYLVIPPTSAKSFRVMSKEPDLYAKDQVSHDEQRPLILEGWHRVLMTIENQARAMSNVAFLD